MKVCVHCFNDLELKQFIVSNFRFKGRCDYCEEDSNSELIEIGELLDFFAEFIQIFNLMPLEFRWLKRYKKTGISFPGKRMKESSEFLSRAMQIGLDKMKKRGEYPV